MYVSRAKLVCALSFLRAWGVRRLQDAGALSALVAAEQPDVICLQETKLQDQHCEGVQTQLGLGPEWRCTWSCSQAAKGYSGTAILTRCAQPFTKQPDSQSNNRKFLSG